MWQRLYVRTKWVLVHWRQQMQVANHMINVEDDYGESDEDVGFSDDGDDGEQEWIYCILIIFFFWSILVCKLDISYLPFLSDIW